MRKINFALGDALGDSESFLNYTFRMRALFLFLLRRPAAEWFENNFTNSTTWENVRTSFITRFLDGWNKFWYQVEMAHCIRRIGEDIRNFLNSIRRTVEKGWHEDVKGIEAGQQKAEPDAKARQRRRGYIDYSLKGLRSTYLRRKA